jgi:predicted dehydrogenase
MTDGRRVPDAASRGGTHASGILRVGIVGCGNVTTRFHLPAYAELSDRVRVVALADVDRDRLAEAQVVSGVADADTHADWRALVARPDVDIVDVATPPRLHAEIAEAAAAAGKHVLCEKPITTIPAEAERMIARCRDAGVALGVWHNWAFYPEILAAEAVVASGEIGAVRLAIVDYLGIPDIKGAGETTHAWRHDPVAAGGGVLMDMLHCLYVTERMIGHDAQRVSAWVSGNADHPQVEATALCRLETDGPVALVNVGWGLGPGGIFVEGTDGTIELRWQDGGTGPFVPLATMEVRTAAGGRREVEVDKLALPEIHVLAMRRLVEDFVEAVRAGREPRMTGADGLHALEVALAAYASAALGRTIEIPLDRADPVYLHGVAAIPGLQGPGSSTVRRQHLYATGPS